MSHGAADRMPIEFDEVDRRMRGAAPRPPGDPLAELARLVTPRETKPAALDAMFASPAHAQPSHYSESLAADDANIDLDALRGSIDASDQHFAAHQGGARREEPDFFADNAYPESASHPAPEEDWSMPQTVERAVPATVSRSRRPLYATAAVIAVGLVGIGTTFAFKGPRSGNGDLVEVKAAPGPTKVQAQATPDRNSVVSESSVLDRGTAQQPVTRVVDRQERPVDLKEASRATPRVVSTMPSSSSQMANLAASAGSDTGGSIFAEPRKVKTVSVRPDGSMVGAATSAPEPAAPSTVSASAPAKTATPKAAARVATTPKASTERPADTGTPRPTVAKADTSTTPTKPAAATPKPTAATAPTKPPVAKPTRVARAADADDDAAPDATADAAPAARSGGSGGFAVQLAAPGSETEARSTASRLGQKYSDALSGTRVTVQKASDKSIYRVRTASMSREDAVAACEKIKAAGGACFVAKN